MARARLPLYAKLAATDPADVPDQDLLALEEYEPPPLTPARLAALAQRRRQVAATPLPKGLPAASRLRAAVAGAKAAPDVAITYDVSLRTWRLLADYPYQYGENMLTAKAGYSFDLASVPRPLWWLIAPNELSILAPLFHDLLYEYRGVLPDETYVNPYRTYTRRETDDLFLHLMEVEGVARWRRLAAYSAVRAAGGLYWDT
ncbi:MAG TPA: DUF1353 domain-containing protein [Gemmataceae bacterium]|nr:DUF1353 domain-containing protein [Gemmataceae bacterium]